MKDKKGDITQLIERHVGGDGDALKELASQVYGHLRKMAQWQMRGNRGHTLTPTALVNEAFLQLLEKNKLDVKNRTHFYAIAAQCMRWLLMDYARAKRQKKRGGSQNLRVTFNEADLGAGQNELDLVEFNELLLRLAEENPRLYKVFELRYFGGVSIDEAAVILGVSASTVKRDWELVKAWLSRELGQSAA